MEAAVQIENLYWWLGWSLLPFLVVAALAIWLKLKGAKLTYLVGFILIGLAIPFLIAQLLLGADVSGPRLKLFAVPIELLLVGIGALFVRRVGCEDAEVTGS